MKKWKEKDLEAFNQKKRSPSHLNLMFLALAATAGVMGAGDGGEGEMGAGFSGGGCDWRGVSTGQGLGVGGRWWFRRVGR